MPAKSDGRLWHAAPEMDHQPMWLCPECVQKIAHARGISLAERYRRLARFAGESGLACEADFWRRSAEAAKGH